MKTFIKIRRKLINFNNILYVGKIDNGLIRGHINSQIGIELINNKNNNLNIVIRFNNSNDRDIEFERIEKIICNN